MCGITGQLYFHPNQKIDGASYYQSHRLIRHRGPDDEGFLGLTSDGTLSHLRGDDTVPAFQAQRHIGEEKSCSGFLGHRRLSILDLSDRGHQPMGDERAGVWVVFNGEIYNFVELREELKALGHSFQSQCDTEVILKGYLEWGDQVFTHFDGMWALALFDQKKQHVLLSRDRPGMKPLYYFLDDQQVVFGSELRFVRSRMPDLSLCHEVAYRYLNSGLLDMDEQTFYEGIKQVRPAETLKIHIKTGHVERSLYWQAPQPGEESKNTTPRDVLEELQHTVKIHLRSDVPLGLALSGGLDSSSLACVIQKDFKGQVNPLNTFSVAYEESDFSEEDNVKATLREIDVKPSWVRPEIHPFSDQLTRLLRVQESPIRSLATLAHLDLMKRVQEENVKVILGGQGADEIFGGYQDYDAFLIADYLSHLSLGKALTEFKASTNTRAKLLRQIIKILFFPRVRLTSAFKNSRLFHSPQTQISPAASNSGKGVFWNALWQDFHSLTLPEYLRYEDRNSMAYSLESRLPFLGRDMMALAFRLPKEKKIHNGIRKHILREAVKERVPAQVVQDRVKKGFTTPHAVWQKGPLKSFFDEIFSSPLLNEVDIFSAPDIRTLYKNDQGHNWWLIWRIACFAFWIKTVYKKPPS